MFLDGYSYSNTQVVSEKQLSVHTDKQVLRRPQQGRKSISKAFGNTSERSTYRLFKGDAEIFSVHSTFPGQLPVGTGIHNVAQGGKGKQMSESWIRRALPTYIGGPASEDL